MVDGLQLQGEGRSPAVSEEGTPSGAEAIDGREADGCPEVGEAGLGGDDLPDIEFDFGLAGGPAGEGAPVGGEPVSPAAQAVPAGPAKPSRPASERIEELFRRMDRQRAVLRAVVGFCEEPRPLASIAEEVRPLQERHRSVFGIEGICSQLENAGALERVLANGEPYAYDENAEPEVEVVDGVERLKPNEPPVVHWRATEDGRVALRKRDPLAKLEKLFDEDAAYSPIYQTVLEMCSADGGAKMGELSKAVDDNPLVQEPRFYAAHFVNNLEACDAVSWEPGWVATEVGLRGLELLAARERPRCDCEKKGE